MMHFRRLLFVAATLALFSHSLSADQPQPTPAQQSLKFLPTTKVITLKTNSRIYDRPGGNALFIVSNAVRVPAQAVSEDGQWWELTLPNGSVGFVPATFLANND
jgi:hypothetical protein